MFYQNSATSALDRSFDSSSSKLQQLKDFYEERLSSLSKQLQLFFSELDSDEIFKAMQENSLSREFAMQRASELFTEIMRSEQEQAIHKQQNELIEYKTLNLKLEYEKQKLSSICESIEENLKKSESEREKLYHELQIAKSRLEEAGYQIEESSKRKDYEWMQKLDMSLRKMEDKLQDSETKYLITRKELDSASLNRKSADSMAVELENLRDRVKNQESSHMRQVDDVRKDYQGIITELERRCESIQNQYKEFKKQSEDLAASQQSVIKNLVDKSKQFKQKIISQKNKLQDFSKLSKESSVNLDAARSNYEKIITELEERIKNLNKEFNLKENENLNKHQSQIINLQNHYQQMMDMKLTEMQKEVEVHIKRSQDHDREVKIIMDQKMKEIDRDYIQKVTHEKILNEKEATLMQKFSMKIEELNKENERKSNDYQRIISEHSRQNEELIDKIQTVQDELLREKEKMGNELNLKLLKVKESENQRIQILKEAEKLRKDLKELQESYEEEVQHRMKAQNELIDAKNSLAEINSDLSQTKQSFKAAKTYHEQMLSEKVDRNDLIQASEKLEVYRKELEKKGNFINNLQDEIQGLENTVRELKGQKVNEIKQFEVEAGRHLETKTQLKELQGYSENLLMELDYRDKKNLELRSQVDTLREESRLKTKELELKDKELFSFKQSTLTRETEIRGKSRISSEKVQKYIKNSSFYLKKQLSSLNEIVEHEYSSFSKFISTIIQEISIKIIELELKYRKTMDIKAEQYGEDIRNHYKQKISQVEESIASENIHWNDPETEGIRRAFKNLIEKKHVNLIEIKSLKESLTKLTDQNENLYRENQKLQIRLHANNEAFDQLQREVTEEANKIKSRLETGKERDVNRSPFYRNY